MSQYLRPAFLTLVVVLLMPLGCSSLLYYPDDVMYVELETMEFQPEEVVFKIESGPEVHSWYFTSKQPAKALIVFFHGNGANRTGHIAGLYWLLRSGYDILALDYPGYADSEGKPTPKNTVETGHAALRYAVKRRPGLPLIVYGQSLGGAVAMRTVIDLKKEITPALVVADSTFASYQRAGKKVLSKSWVTWLMQPLANLVLSDEYAPGDAIAEISPVPLLVIHSKEDRVIPYVLGEEVFAKARSPKEFWRLEAGPHIATFALPGGVKNRTRFIEKLASLGI